MGVIKSFPIIFLQFPKVNHIVISCPPPLATAHTPKATNESPKLSINGKLCGSQACDLLRDFLFGLHTINYRGKFHKTFVLCLKLQDRIFKRQVVL